MGTSFTLQLSQVTFFFHLKQYVNYWLWSEIYLLYAVEQYMGTDKVVFGGGSMGIGPLRMTGSHVSRVTGKSPDRKYVQCKPVFPAFYIYYSSSTSTMATCDRRSRDPLWCFLGCAHAQPEVAQYQAQWGLFTGSDVMKRYPVVTFGSHEGGGRGVCMRNRKLSNIRPSGGLLFSSPARPHPLFPVN